MKGFEKTMLQATEANQNPKCGDDVFCRAVHLQANESSSYQAENQNNQVYMAKPKTLMIVEVYTITARF